MKFSTDWFYLVVHWWPVNNHQGWLIWSPGKLEITQKNLEDNECKCNIKHSLFGETDTEYLGFWVTLNGVRTINKINEDIINMTPPKIKLRVGTFICLVNYYRYMLSRWSHLLQLLNNITSDKVAFKWIDAEHKSFDDIKYMVARNNLFSYPYLNKLFDIHTNASNYHIGAVTIQYEKPVSFYRRKITVIETCYKVTIK